MQAIYYPNLSGSIGFESMFVFFKLTSLFMVTFVCLGAACFLNLDPAIAHLESLHSSPSHWNEDYGSSAPLGSVKDLVTVFFHVTGAVCLVLAFFLFILFRRGIEIGNT